MTKQGRRRSPPGDGGEALGGHKVWRLCQLARPRLAPTLQQVPKQRRRRRGPPGLLVRTTAVHTRPQRGGLHPHPCARHPGQQLLQWRAPRAQARAQLNPRPHLQAQCAPQQGPHPVLQRPLAAQRCVVASRPACRQPHGCVLPCLAAAVVRQPAAQPAWHGRVLLAPPALRHRAAGSLLSARRQM